MIMRRVCKESPKEAIDRQVILEIKHLLKNSTLTAAQIALRLHFPDPSYLSRYFRKHTGTSITAYRTTPSTK